MRTERNLKVELPGGLVDAAGAVWRDVELSPLTGFDEERMAGTDFAAGRAEVITAVLARCLASVGTYRPVPPALVSDLLVSDREFLLLALREVIFGRRVTAVLRCTHAGCAAPMDMELDLTDFMPAPHPVSDRLFTIQVRDSAGAHGPRVTFRLPTGTDQSELAPLVARDPASVVDRFLARLVLQIDAETDITPERIARLPEDAKIAIEREMERLAPPLDIELDAVCIECKRPFVLRFDPCGLFLEELQRGLGRLEREVHVIASHYHWSESAILGLSRRKRRAYLDLIEQDGVASAQVEWIEHAVG